MWLNYQGFAVIWAPRICLAGMPPRLVGARWGAEQKRSIGILVKDRKPLGARALSGIIGVGDRSYLETGVSTHLPGEEGQGKP